MRTSHGWVAGLAVTALGAGCGTVTAKPDAGGGSGDADGAIDGPSGSASLAVMPLTQEFGPVALAASSAPVTFTFTNTGTGPATGCAAPEKTGDAPSEFEITNDTCGTSDLAGGASCTVQVAAKPTVNGIRTMTLSRTCATGGTASTVADALAVNRPMYIFVTSTETNGNLAGLAGADGRCATHAANGTATGPLGKTWKALLSQSTGTVVHAKDRFVWTGPLYDMNNALVTRDPSVWPWVSAGTGGTTRRTENNTVAGSYTWTNTMANGLAFGADCNAWASNLGSVNGRAGETASFPGEGWISSFTNACDSNFFGLYCVSQ